MLLKSNLIQGGRILKTALLRFDLKSVQKYKKYLLRLSTEAVLNINTSCRGIIVPITNTFESERQVHFQSSNDVSS